jgi:hypothetical protein
MTEAQDQAAPETDNAEVAELAQASAEPAEVQEASVVLTHRPYRGQAAHDAARRERKLRAADTIKANAKAAQAAKRKAQAKAPTVEGRAAFEKRAAEITERINKDK